MSVIAQLPRRQSMDQIHIASVPNRLCNLKFKNHVYAETQANDDDDGMKHGMR
jgi:hypothetical protein